VPESAAPLRHHPKGGYGQQGKRGTGANMTTTTQFITCTRCQKDKLFTEFYHDKHKRNGRKSWCRQCVKEYNREYG
jgi:hypothetical protein